MNEEHLRELRREFYDGEIQDAYRRGWLRGAATVLALCVIVYACPARADDLPVPLDDAQACGTFVSLDSAMRRGDPVDVGERAWWAHRCDDFEIAQIGAAERNERWTRRNTMTRDAIAERSATSRAEKGGSSATQWRTQRPSISANTARASVTSLSVANATTPPTLDNAHWRPPYNIAVRYSYTTACAPCARWGDTLDSAEWTRRYPDRVRRTSAFNACKAQRGWCDVFVRVSDGGAFPWVPQKEGAR